MSKKAEERTDLLIHLGQLLAPLKELADRKEPPQSVEYRVVAAKFNAALQKWEIAYREFATFGEDFFQVEFHRVHQHAHNLRRELNSFGSENVEDLARCHGFFQKHFAKTKQALTDYVNLIPVEWESKLYAAKSPLTVSLLIWDAVSTATKRVDYLDRYLHEDFFPLYLRKLPRTVAVTLVTTAGNANFGVANVLPLAKRAAQEFDSFRLIECSPKDMHDRNLRVDNTVFHLGSSEKDAGKYPTNFSKLDSTGSDHDILNDLIAKGTYVSL